MKRTHEDTIAKATEHVVEDDDEASSGADKPSLAHPELFLVPLQPDHVYIYFQYFAFDSADPEAPPAALLDVASLSPKRLARLLADLRADEGIANYIGLYVNGQTDPDEVEDLDLDLAKLCGSWSAVPAAGVVVKVSSFVVVNGVY
jgi:hypothetical protein